MEGARKSSFQVACAPQARHRKPGRKCPCPRAPSGSGLQAVQQFSTVPISL